MRGFGSLIIFFIGVVVVYGVYWASRAASAAKDAAYYVKETGSVGEAVKRLWASQRLPDPIRLSGPQTKFMDFNRPRFHRECESEVKELAERTYRSLLAGLNDLPLGYKITEEQLREQALLYAYLAVAKQWCAQQGVS